LKSAVGPAQASLSEARRVLAEEYQRARVSKESWSASGIDGKAPGLALGRPQVREARARVVAATAEVASAQYNLSRTNITVPYDGVVIERLISPGDFVQPGTPVGRVFDRGTFEVVVPMTAVEIDRLNQEIGEVAVKLFGTSNPQTWDGVLSRIEQTVDTQSSWKNVVVDVKNTAGLSPGEFLRAEFLGPKQEDVLSVPGHLLAPDGALWLVDDRDLLRRIEPTILFQAGGSVFLHLPGEGQLPVRVAQYRNTFVMGAKVQAGPAASVRSASFLASGEKLTCLNQTKMDGFPGLYTIP